MNASHTLKSLVSLCSALLVAAQLAVAADAPGTATVVPAGPLAGETPPQRDARLTWWKEARYGLFIHWGLYAVPAGSYQGRKIDRSPTEGNGLGEWIMHNAKIPVVEYASYARQFNPVKFDADAWVRLAAEAGMKYIVITTKHHDGFAMFKSAASPFNIVDATPFGRDPLKELAEACARHGIKLGFYYSHAQDWHHAGGAAWGRGNAPWSGGDPAIGHWDRAQAGSFDEYLDKVAIPQVRELLTNYGPISVLWWDTPVGMTPERSVRLAELLKLQPQLVTNNRLLNPRDLNPYSGDTETPEQFIPATGFKDRLFEVCMTMNETWGYKAHDHEWKPAADITRKLIDIASKGGNFLLNVGPTAEGEIPAPSVERLRESGRWVKQNGEAIFGTTASLFRRLPWGRSTTKGKTLYLHVFDWPEDGRLVVPGLKSKVRRASLLGGRDSLRTVSQGGDVVVTLSGPASDPVASVIKLEFEGVPVVDQPLPGPNAAGAIDLPANLVAIVNAYGANTRLMGSGSTAHVGAWDRVGTVLSWEFSGAAGKYRLEAEVAAAGEAALGVACGSTKSVAKIASTGGLDEYRFVALGSVTLGAAAEHNLELKSQGKTWSEIRLRRVRLVPAP